MKTSLTLLWIAVAGVVAYTIYQSLQPQRLQSPIRVDLTPLGVRVPIKNGDVNKFEDVLKTISNQNNTNGNKGMCVNILYPDPNDPEHKNWYTINGPPFTSPSKVDQPDGSMHVTQSLLFNSLDQLNDVLNLLETDTTKPTTIQAQCP